MLGFHGKNVEEQACDGVVAEVEVFEVDAALCLPECLKHVVELFLSAHQQGDTVVVGEADAFVTEVVDDERVGRLGLCKSSVN